MNSPLRLAASLLAISISVSAPASADDNDCFTPINGGLKGEPANDQDNVFHSLVIDPTDERVVYVGTEGNGIFKTSDGGLTWTRLRSGLKCTVVHSFYPEIYDLAVNPLAPNTIYAGTVNGPGPPAPT